MTGESYDRLSDDEKRIKVADLHGWRLPYVDQPPAKPFHYISRLAPGHKWGEPFHEGPLPDYLNDLNACHEMEQLIYKAKRVDDRECGMIDYCDAVGAIVSASGAYRQQQAVHATAADRCKAFVLTMTKEEGDD